MSSTNNSLTQLVLAATFLILLLAVFILSILFLYRKKQISYLKELESIRSESEKAILNTQLEIQEQTLQSISREIHDHICLNLTLAKLNLVTLDLPDPSNNIERINSSIDLLTKSIHELSDMSHSMNPAFIEDFGLIKTLELEAEKIKKAGLLDVSMTLEGNSVFMNSQTELVIFRIVQEAFNNVLKHATAKKVILGLYYNENCMEAFIQDDGVGFSTEMQSCNGETKHRSGLVNMKKRAKLINGDCEVISEIGKGTTIHLSIPY